jgi:hypothetical protein
VYISIFWSDFDTTFPAFGNAIMLSEAERIAMHDPAAGNWHEMA